MNQVFNFFWTIIGFLPVCIYWMNSRDLTACWYLICVSVLALFVPAKWLQLSLVPRFYERLGARFVKKFVQNGDYAKRNRIISNKANAHAYTKTILMYEKFHLLCLMFFLLTSIDAFVYKQYVLAALVFVANLIYNVYPILLQQYNRARMIKITRR